MPTKFVNDLETSKRRIRGHYLDSVSYVLLHFLTLRLFENLALEYFSNQNPKQSLQENVITVFGPN